MTFILTVAYLAIAAVLLWHSAESADRRPLHRAMLYAFGFAAMCFGSARFLMLTGTARADWQWIFDLGHVALIGFAVMWIARETGLARFLRENGE